MTIRKIVRVITTAGRDADRARRTAHTPEFRKAVTKDRRGALSGYRAVKDALKDRERIERSKAAKVIKAPRKK